MFMTPNKTSPMETWWGIQGFESTGTGLAYSKQSIVIYTISNAGGNLARGFTQDWQEVRCDNQMPGNIGPGCAYHRVPGLFVLKGTADLVPQAAAWYKQAQDRLAGNPGRPINGTQLHRATAAEHDANRVVSRRFCATFPVGAGEDCDEYPYAATREGAARPLGAQRVTWDVMGVPSGQNQLAGALLGGFYTRQRMLPGDAFYAQMLP